MAEPSFHVDAARAHLAVLARTNLFYFEIGKVPGGGGTPEDVLFSAETAVVPGKDSEAIPVPWMNSQYKYAGPTTYANFTVNFRVDQNYRTYDLINAWHNLIFNPETGAGDYPEQYMCDAKVTLLSIKGERKKAWRFIGMFPSTLGPVDLNRGGGDNMIVSLTFEYQYWVMLKSAA